ncbi:C4-dicarboxylate transporter DctA [Kutzneria buriramensis]|uniref:Aerobic C4-dicarboxylate transport protein n=1 Tax=Kutzneria buriramensis TaxID=1045776 RepID=A0A3E0HZY0_9PSEU|nr:C4-dicarboxylate transporter DctA [Kutzneria buriramensis]REH52027.1 aerobic C4-dicarboxylate transport protein [Kutzneria buriramensis]
MSTATATRKPWVQQLYFWVIAAIVLGIVFGLVFPHAAANSKWLADLFVNLIRMVTAPVIFLTVVVGIASLGNLAKAGGLALRAIGYFIVMTLVALVIGLVVVNVLQPGTGLNLHVDPKAADSTIKAAGQATEGVTDFILSLVPSSFVGAFTGTQLIQVLVVAVFVAIGLSTLGERGKPILRAFESLQALMFAVIKAVMWIAPIGAFGGIAYTVGAFGSKILGSLAFLMLAFYLTCILFIVVVLGLIARFVGFNLFKFLRYIKDELLIVLGTSSSETVLPRLMTKLEAAGASRSVVGLTVPTGYSFNLDGTCIYLTMGALFIAQATGHEIGIGTQIGLLLFMLLSSKGAAGVTGAGLVTLAASLSAFGTVIPVVGIALIVGIDRFMSEARAITNVIGNGVGSLVVARWQGELDRDRLREVLDNPSAVDAEKDAAQVVTAS